MYAGVGVQAASETMNRWCLCIGKAQTQSGLEYSHLVESQVKSWASRGRTMSHGPGQGKALPTQQDSLGPQEEILSFTRVLPVTLEGLLLKDTLLLLYGTEVLGFSEGKT